MSRAGKGTTMDPSAFIALIPEPWRTYVLATLFAVVAAQMAASLIVALLPAWTFVHPVYGRYARGLAAFGHFKPSDAPGTLKAPLSALDPRALAEIERVAAQAQRVVDFTRPPPSDGQSGRARLGALVVLLVVGLGAGALLQGCPPPPPSDGGTPVVTPSEWTRTARLATTVGRGLIPVAQVIVEATTTDPGRTQARRAFVAADAALVGLDRALDAYDARGGDRCAAHAAAGAAVVALTELAEVLAANGIALGVPLGRVVDLVGSVVDTLVPACNLDAGFASAGRAANATLLTIERDARSRGVILRRDLDRITPALDGGVR
jgi:hypothetical protein